MSDAAPAGASDRARDPEALRAAFRGAGAAGDALVGLWASIPSPLTAEAAALAGAPYVVVDHQHGAVEPGTLMGMLQAIAGGGAAPMVRVARNDPWIIGSALDLGALGVIVPMVEDAAQAAAAVAACRYAPDGIRSWGALRGSPHPAPVCLVMIETRAGLEQVREIVATPGLDGVYVGPSDLALSLGLRPTRDIEHPPVLAAIDEIREACAAAGLIAGVHCLSGEDAARHRGRGFGLVTAGGDMPHLQDALGAALEAAAARDGG
jgi:4-hydroxy-2-oxoheptanedioate aldolase